MPIDFCRADQNTNNTYLIFPIVTVHIYNDHMRLIIKPNSTVVVQDFAEKYSDLKNQV